MLEKITRPQANNRGLCMRADAGNRTRALSSEMVYAGPGIRYGRGQLVFLSELRGPGEPEG